MNLRSIYSCLSFWIVRCGINIIFNFWLFILWLRNVGQIWSCPLWKRSTRPFSSILISRRLATFRGVYRSWRFYLVISGLPLLPLWSYQFGVIWVLVLIRTNLFSLVFAPSFLAALVWHLVRHRGGLGYDFKFQFFCWRLFVLSIVVWLLSTFDPESIKCRPCRRFDNQWCTFVHFYFILFDFNQISHFIRGFLITLGFLFELMHQFEDNLITIALG